MLIQFDKTEVKQALTTEKIYDIVTEWGGNPIWTSFGFISETICHNPPGEGKHKLYYYNNSGLFKCFTGCEKDIFDIFELCMKAAYIQKDEDWDLNKAVRFVASQIGFLGSTLIQVEDSPDWDKFSIYDRLQEIEIKDYNIVLKNYDDIILSRFNYEVKIKPWLNDYITQVALKIGNIGYYPGEELITIPHYDKNNRFIGLRGRKLDEEKAERFGKYAPIKICGTLYSHPLGMNLYGLNWSYANINRIKKAIIFESEKSVLQFISYFGEENNIAVACCGSSISLQQIHFLLQAGASEITIALDRQFQELNDQECRKLVHLLKGFHNKYSKYCLISFIFDKQKLTNYKDSPTDEGKEIFMELYSKRISL